ncbi:SAP domain-containing protein [Candidatus Poseidonia alphae]|uniref:SAP domain-containing protein n=1 Tax=Candidatus Poseidonia alphae TaxID=1915863 RepID=UPI0030C6EF59
MDYESLTLLELKKQCKSRGLKISGSKDDVVIRLMEADEAQNGGCFNPGSFNPLFTIKAD